MRHNTALRVVDDYAAFLDRRSQSGEAAGLSAAALPDFLFPFQAHLVEWALKRGRAAIFADCGLGKTPMQLAWADAVVRQTNKPVLILTPLAVGRQTVLEGQKFGIDCYRSRDGAHHGGIVVSNYEQLHRFNWQDFAGIVCDESSILKRFTGATQKGVTRFASKIPYRLLCTATAAPNDYIELGTSSEALGELGYTDMLGRFFRQTDNKPHRMEEIKQQRAERLGRHFAKLAFRVSQTIGQWRLKGHAVQPFWRWVASWARACRRPSDLGFDDTGFILPELVEREHVITPARPRDGMLFTIPAVGLQEEREERRRTLDERCGLVARLVDHDRPAVVWCHLNAEGDRLEQTIPFSLQVAGRHDDDYKETVAEWFVGERCLCSDSRFRDKLAAWQKDVRVTGQSSIDAIAASELRRQANISANIKKSAEPTCVSGMPPTASEWPSIDERKRTSETRSDASDMPQTRRSGRVPLKRPEHIASGGQNGDAPVNSLNVECRSNNMPSSSQQDALFADTPTAKTNAATDCTLITTTTPGDSEDCSVSLVITDSGNVPTTRHDWSEPRCICGHHSGHRVLISKPKVLGFGLNWQHCNHVVTFASHSYEQYYQAVRRCWRFGQQSPVTVDIIVTEGERHVMENMQRKARAAAEMFSELVSHMNDARHGRRDYEPVNIEVPTWL